MQDVGRRSLLDNFLGTRRRGRPIRVLTSVSAAASYPETTARRQAPYRKTADSLSGKARGDLLSGERSNSILSAVRKFAGNTDLLATTFLFNGRDEA